MGQLGCGSRTAVIPYVFSLTSFATVSAHNFDTCSCVWDRTFRSGIFCSVSFQYSLCSGTNWSVWIYLMFLNNHSVCSCHFLQLHMYCLVTEVQNYYSYIFITHCNGYLTAGILTLEIRQWLSHCIILLSSVTVAGHEVTPYDQTWWGMNHVLLSWKLTVSCNIHQNYRTLHTVL